MRAVVIGAVESTQVAVRTIARTPGWKVPAVLTLPTELAARHSDFVDLAADAAAADAQLLRCPDVNAPDVIGKLRAIGPDYVFVIGWSQICRRDFLAAHAERVIGYHPAPLPRLRGRAAIPWTILLDEKITASSLFWIDAGTDTGPLLAQRYFHVAPDETALSLYRRHLAALEELLAEALPRLQRGDAPRIPQDERFATSAAKRTPEDGEIDWSRPAAEIWRLVRAVGRPYPGAFTWLDGEKLIVWGAEVSADGARHAAALPGQVVERDGATLAVRCGDGGVLRLLEWESGTGKPPRLHARLGGRR